MDGHRLEFVGNSITEVGSVENYPLSANIFAADGSNMTDNYDIIWDPGILTVVAPGDSGGSGGSGGSGDSGEGDNPDYTGGSGGVNIGEPSDLIIYGGSAEREYDGSPLTCRQYRYEGKLQSGHRISFVKLVGTITDVGLTENTIEKVKIVDGYGNDVSSLYRMAFVPGTLRIHPKNITIRTADITAVYTGYPVTSNRWWLVGSTVNSNETVNVTVTGSRTEIGSSPNTVGKVTVTRDGKDITGNYCISYVTGTITVKKD